MSDTPRPLPTRRAHIVAMSPEQLALLVAAGAEATAVCGRRWTPTSADPVDPVCHACTQELMAAYHDREDRLGAVEALCARAEAIRDTSPYASEIPAVLTSDQIRAAINEGPK